MARRNGGVGGHAWNYRDATYGRHYARLAEVKRRYDPDNLFRVNHNIRPE